MNYKFLIAIVLIAVVIFFIEFSKAPVIEEELGVMDESDRVLMKEAEYPRALEIVDPEGYINVDNITLSEHIGKKVILIDFWTYSCINCQRTFPYLRAWHEKYDGLLIVGVHTPEFNFEKEYENVVDATERFGITWPVVQDNDKQTWRAYQNRFWPRKYLIDIDGFIRYDHIGEGAHEETERKIQELLKERRQVSGTGNSGYKLVEQLYPNDQYSKHPKTIR